MNENGPRIAVVIPCFNDGLLLRETLASIDESEPVEIAIVDDASPEPATLAILDELADAGVMVLRHAENRGPAAARNTGVAATGAPYVFPLDSDDLSVPGVLGAMADRLDGDSGAAVCYGDYDEFGDHELVRAVPPALDAFRIAYTNEYPISALFRRTALGDVGGWRDPEYEDWGLWMSLAERGFRATYLGVGRLTFRRRLHGQRRLDREKREHATLYRRLKRSHPMLFSDLHRHRRASDLPAHRKALYPIVYGGRRRFGYERHVKQLLDRAGVWTLRR